MELPIKFPDEGDKIHEEALAFRRLSADEKWAEFMDLLALGESMMNSSPNREAIKRLQQEHEDQWQKAQRELFLRAMDFEHFGLPEGVQSGLGHMAEALDAAKVRYALIGGIALGFRSRPRFTNDIDFLLSVPQIKLPGLLEDLRNRGFDIDTAKTIEEWTKYHLTVVEFKGVRIDWLKPVLPLYKHVIDTAKPVLWNGGSLLIASPESLILTKLIAFRGQDQADIEALLAANRGQLDIAYIRSEWATIAPEDDPRMQRFLEMVTKFDKRA